MWYAVCARESDDPDEQVYTLSNFPDRDGWNTDSGFVGYGLSKANAEFLADAANEKLARDMEQIEIAAIELWHRFAPDSRLSWEDETHKAEYVDAAQAVFRIAGEKASTADENAGQIGPGKSVELIREKSDTEAGDDLPAGR